MDVLSLIKQSLITDNSNPITKHFELGRQVASGGPEMVWKIFDAIRIKDKTRASVFLFEKKIAEKIHRPKRKDIVTEILRKEIRLLTRLRHSKILRVLHPIEECQIFIESNHSDAGRAFDRRLHDAVGGLFPGVVPRHHRLRSRQMIYPSDSLAFAVEPIFASLANVLGNHERLPASIPPEIKISDALSYLHNTEHMLHLNVCPSSVFITHRGMWKLGGFGFAERPRESSTALQDAFPVLPWSPKHHKMAQPDMDYIAPEIQLETITSASPACDMYSLGMLICAVYNNGKSLVQAAHAQSNYVKQIDRMTELFGEVAHRMPLELVEPVEKMINKDIRYRSTALGFMQLKYFDDPLAKCMLHLDSVDAQDLSQKCEFFTRLAQAIPAFPKKMLYKSVLPMLIQQLQQHDMLVLVLPSVLSLIACSSPEEYCSSIHPHFNQVFSMARPMQATVYLLEKLDIILDKASEDDIKCDVLPMIFSTLESNSIQGHEAAIGVFTIIRKYIDDTTIRKLVLPKAKALFYKSNSVQTKMNALACVDRLLDSLDKMIILDEVLPFITDINCSDVDIIMSVTAIYQHLLCDRKFGLTHNLLATKIMPSLIPHTVSPGLSIDQFNILMDLLRAMLSQIDRERRLKMISEVPDTSALELRSNLQQLQSCYMGSRMGSPRLPSEEYGMISGSRPYLVGKRSSIGSSNSSIGSSYSRHSSRRGSGEMRYGRELFDASKLETPFGNRYLLTVDEGYYQRHRRDSIHRYGYRQGEHGETMFNTVPNCKDYQGKVGLFTPSTPELQTKGSSKESLDQNAYKRYSSFQGLGMEEQAVLEKIVRERRASLAPRSGGATPHIMVSEASIPDRHDGWFSSFGAFRRASTQSMGPVVVPEPGRRDSRGRLLDCIQNEVRRSSFQGICETAMQFFGGK